MLSSNDNYCCDNDGISADRVALHLVHSICAMAEMPETLARYFAEQFGNFMQVLLINDLLFINNH